MEALKYNRHVFKIMNFWCEIQFILNNNNIFWEIKLAFCHFYFPPQWCFALIWFVAAALLWILCYPFNSIRRHSTADIACIRLCILLPHRNAIFRSSYILRLIFVDLYIYFYFKMFYPFLVGVPLFRLFPPLCALHSIYSLLRFLFIHHSLEWLVISSCEIVWF